MALPITALLALSFVSRDLAAFLGWHRILPRPRGHRGEPFPPSARKFASCRLALAVVIAIASLATDTSACVAGIPAMYAVSSAIVREHYPDMYGGPSYIR